MSQSSPLTPRQFVDRWRGSTSTERRAYQQHFLDLCHLAGHPIPVELDPENKFFTFEAGATKQSGGQGWADVWYRGHFAIEYKGPHGDLDKAYSQLLQYRESLENPPLLIVSNLQSIVVHTNFTGTAKQIVTIALDDLLTPAGLQTLRNIFYNPEAFRPEKTAAQVTEEAAAQFGTLAAHLTEPPRNNNPHDVAHYLIRLLFCMFAEDIQLLPKDLFTRLVERGRKDSKAFNAQVKNLLAAMKDGEFFGEHQIKYFNGGLFDGGAPVDLDSEAIAILHQITGLDWSSIEPAIFGTLFTRSLDPQQRARLGAQYTSKDDILLVVEPVLMEPLRREWAGVQETARDLARKRDGAATRAVASKAQNDLSSLIQGFAQKLASVRVLDPASGSGNFLYVSLRLLLELWKEVSVFGGEVGLTMLSPLPGFSPSPAQLYGIEVNDYAHELAQATVWIGYLQWLHENGFGITDEPILRPLDNIKHMDAILAYDAAGKPVEPRWPEADVIVGNPPFLGGKRMRAELGNAYVDDLFRLYKGQVPHECDLVCYWFHRSTDAMSDGKVKRIGLLATQAIRGGVNRTVLERIKQSGSIFWAESDRDWVLDGATVHVSMIGFSSEQTQEKMLDGRSVSVINPDLTSTIDLTGAKQLPENAHLSYMGVTPAGPFDVAGDLAQEWIHASRSSGAPDNFYVLKPYFNGQDLTQRNRNVWIIDFGTELSELEASTYALPFSYVVKHVKPLRDKNNREAYRKYWWRHAEARPAMRRALAGLSRFIGTSMVSKHHIMCWIPQRVLPANLIIVVARPDDYMFGLLQSWPHELWARQKGTQLREAESGYRYTPTTTFETYPFPWPPGQEPQDDPRVQAIAAAAKELVELRDAWLNPPGLSEKELQKRTLTNLYNARPDWLDAAHKQLDAAVFDAYGWPHDLADEEILARLLALNLERAG